MEFEKGEVKSLDGLQRALSMIRKYHERMELQALQCFLIVAAEPGIHSVDIAKKAGLSGAAVSRIARHVLGHEGELQWMIMREDPLDARFKSVRLTPKGVEIARRVAGVL